MAGSLPKRIVRFVRFVRFTARIVQFSFLLLGAGIAQADLFSGFYTSKAPQKQSLAVPVQTETTGARCIAAILGAQQRYGIPDNLLLSIGIQEAGRKGPAGLAVWPWTVNANGEGAFFKTRQEAQDWVREKQGQGINSIDVGCMQVNLRWHGDQFPHQDAAFDPMLNADYAARFLLSLKKQTGSWQKAAGRYHSATEKYQKRYLASLARNQGVVARDFARLSALAGQVGAVQVVQAVVPEVKAPPVFWGGEAGSNYSIYSNAPLQPILPQYREAF